MPCYAIINSQNKSTQSQISSATLAQATCLVTSSSKGVTQLPSKSIPSLPANSRQSDIAHISVDVSERMQQVSELQINLTCVSVTLQPPSKSSLPTINTAPQLAVPTHHFLK